jgi:uncharacterized protein DUF6755
VERAHHGTTLMTAICAFTSVLVIIQLWIIAASLDAFLSGDRTVLAPAAIVSVVLFAVNAALLAHALRFDRQEEIRESKP